MQKYTKSQNFEAIYMTACSQWRNCGLSVQEQIPKKTSQENDMSLS